MNRNAGFAIALGIALSVTLLMSILLLLPECAYEPARQSCEVAKDKSVIAYAFAAVALTALSIIAHLKGARTWAFLCLASLLVVPFLAGRLAS